MASFRSNKVANKQRRQQQYLKVKKEKESTKRDERFKRRRREDQNPQLRSSRRSKNVPVTIDGKRKWDAADLDDSGPNFGVAVDLFDPKRRKAEADETADTIEGNEQESESDEEEDLDNEHQNQALEQASLEAESHNDIDSMLDSDSSDDEDEQPDSAKPKSPERPASEAPSVATDLAYTPEALVRKFPSLFEPPEQPKVLITTSLNSTLHHEADLLTFLFPNSAYIRRTAHFHSYKYSLREISTFAASRNYTTVVVLNEERKKPRGLDIVHLPHGPTFHFSISNWIPGRSLPGHGNPTNHYPELILHGFRTSLGLVTATLFRNLFPQRPEVQGRQVVTLHNQRDYVFLRRHRYVFRDKRESEKSVQGHDGKPVKGMENIRAGLQELGPRFTLKLRRIDRGIQRASGQEWEWKARSEKVRTRFNL